MLPSHNSIRLLSATDIRVFPDYPGHPHPAILALDAPRQRRYAAAERAIVPACTASRWTLAREFSEREKGAA